MEEARNDTSMAVGEEVAREMGSLDNARRLRGIFFVGPDDQDYKDTEKIGKTYGSDRAVQKESSNLHHEGRCKAGICIPKDSKNVS